MYSFISMDHSKVSLPGYFGKLNLESDIMAKLSESEREDCISKHAKNSAPAIAANLFPALRSYFGKNKDIAIIEGLDYVAMEKRIADDSTNNSCLLRAYSKINFDGMTIDIALNETNKPNSKDSILNGTDVLTAVICLLADDDEIADALNALEPYLTMDDNNNSLVLADAQKTILINMALITSHVMARYTISNNQNAVSIKEVDATKSLYYRDFNDADFICKAVFREVNPEKNSYFRVVKTETKKEKKNITSKNFNNLYRLNENRVWTKEEAQMIPVLDESYHLPDFVVRDTQWIKVTSGENKPIRTLYYRGPAGTGKTQGFRAVCAGLGIPYSKTTCSTDSEIFNFLGQVFPAMDDKNPVTAADIIKSKKLPSFDDVSCDPQGAYKQMMGKEMPDSCDEVTVYALLMEKVLEGMRELVSNNGKEFHYVESALIKAVKNGYGHEIQEPTVIKRPGVLVGLNAIFESATDNYFELPNGDLIKKHPDCVICLTSNSDYEGCCLLNQSVLDRMSIIHDIDEPSKEEKKKRIKAKIGFENDALLNRMFKIVEKMQKHCREHDITDGVLGVRALEDWCIACKAKAMIEECTLAELADADVYECALATILGKSSQTDEDREELKTILESEFIPV